MYNACQVCYWYQISLWDSHSFEISGLQTERAVSLHSESDDSDLSLESSNWESLHNSLGWTGLDLDVLAEHELGSSLRGWLDTGLDPAEAWNGEDASLLDLSCGQGRQAGNESRSNLGLELVLLSEDFHEGTLGHDLVAGLHGLHSLHRSHGERRELMSSKEVGVWGGVCC